MTVTSAEGGHLSRGDDVHLDFRSLLDTHFESMRRLAFLLGADDPEAVAQEAFVRLHTRWTRLRDGDKALAYVRVIVTNLSRSRVRHLRIVRRTPLSAAANAPSAEAVVLPRHGPLWTALESLTTRQRQVVVLRYWLDLSLADIAATLGLSTGTVKATQSHAVAKLRAALNEEKT